MPKVKALPEPTEEQQAVEKPQKSKEDMEKDYYHNAQIRVSKARTQLLLKREYTFWATVGFYQQLIFTDSCPGGLANPTMATDGEHIYINVDFVNKLNNDELMFVLAHEAGHCALGHHLRRGNRDRFGWNIAADFALNPILKATGLTPPKDVLLDDQFKDMNAELIYTKIPVKKMHMSMGKCSQCGGTGKQQNQGQNPGQDPQDQQGQGNQPCPACQGTGNTGDFGSCGQVMDSQLIGKDENGIKRWEIIVRQAAAQAKQQGHLPGNFEYLIEPIPPKLDLESMLRHLISAVEADDYSWGRPNRRHVWNDVYLPSLYSESVGEIVVAIDVSGSIGKDEAAKFLGTVNIVLGEFKPKKLHFLQCDAAVQSYEELTGGTLLPEKVGIKGGGGTDMRPIWEFLREEGINPVTAIVCSDFEMSMDCFGPEQEFPVLWVTCSRGQKAPWGLSVDLKNLDEE